MPKPLQPVPLRTRSRKMSFQDNSCGCSKARSCKKLFWSIPLGAQRRQHRSFLPSPHPTPPAMQPSRTTPNPHSFSGEALTMPTSAMLASLTCLLQLLLWFVLTFTVAQKSMSAPKKPVALTAHAAKPWPPWRGKHLHLKDPPLPCHCPLVQKGG